MQRHSSVAAPVFTLIPRYVFAFSGGGGYAAGGLGVLKKTLARLLQVVEFQNACSHTVLLPCDWRLPNGRLQSRLSCIRLMISRTRATTSRRWIKLPPMWPSKPTSHSTSKMTIIVQSTGIPFDWVKLLPVHLSRDSVTRQAFSEHGIPTANL
jgi:hypothetical protein